MKAIDIVTLATLVCGGMSCGGSSDPMGVSVNGKSPSEAAYDDATAICQKKAQCGIVDVMCSGGTNMSTQCSATIDHPDAMTCVAQEQPSFERVFSCPAVTAALLDTIQQCVDAIVAQPCVTQAEADALAMTAQETMQLPPDSTPAVCAPLLQPIPGCQ